MDLASTNLTVTHTSTVTADQIDDLGHMNVRYYGVNAQAGTEELCRRLGLTTEVAVRSRYTRHHREQLEGRELEVASAVLDPATVGGSFVRLYHELRHRADGELAATFVHELDHPVLEVGGITLPDHGRPRSLRLDTDGLAAAPPLAELRERGLAVRRPRTVTTEDTQGAETVPPWLANNLIWGGERPDDETDWIRVLANGDRYAFAVMESRMWVASRPVPVGTPIESFGANVAIGEKITHDLAWSFDTSTGEVLAVIEGIDVCFNLSQRRAMALPDEAIERQRRTFHPEYLLG